MIKEIKISKSIQHVFKNRGNFDIVYANEIVFKFNNVIITIVQSDSDQNKIYNVYFKKGRMLFTLRPEKIIPMTRNIPENHFITLSLYQFIFGYLSLSFDSLFKALYIFLDSEDICVERETIYLLRIIEEEKKIKILNDLRENINNLISEIKEIRGE